MTDCFPPPSNAFILKCRMKKRMEMAKGRAEKYAAVHCHLERGKWILSYEGDRDGEAFKVALAEQTARLEEQGKELRSEGCRQPYKYCHFEQFDPRVGFIRPVYALPRSSSTMAPRDPS